METYVIDYRPKAFGMRTHFVSELSLETVGKEVSLCGFVNSVRVHGENLVFVDLRDITGTVQVVTREISGLHQECVIRVKGIVRKRPEGTENDKLTTGQIEVSDCDIEIISRSQSIPFQLSNRRSVDEQTRLRFRYLDLRTPEMRENILLRAQITQALRKSIISEGFIEIETPLLWVPTPEGAREFIVPSRLQKGSFYALPQSPQIAKQLLMVAGFERYFQVARCLRDEDLRADRQFEFTQLDLEASFVTSADVINVASLAVKSAMAQLGLTEQITFEELKFDEALKKYGTDKPDLRIKGEIADFSEVFKNTEINALRADKVLGFVLKRPELSRAKLDNLVIRAKELGGSGLLWMKLSSKSDLEFESPISKYLTDAEKTSLALGNSLEEGDLILLAAGSDRLIRNLLGVLRIELKDYFEKDPFSYKFLWITDFPLFEEEDGRLIAQHHPFTKPKDEDIDFLNTNPAKVRAQAYDLVLNGWELGSGSMRIHDPKIQGEVFKLLGISEEESREKFGFLLDAFSYGVPPHGGFALGIDRFVAIIAGAETIRDVIAFPKTQGGQDLMTKAPGQVSNKLKQELGLYKK